MHIRCALAMASALFLLPVHSHAQSIFSLARAGSAEEVTTALAQGCTACDHDEQGASPLIVAAGCNPDPDVIRVLVMVGAKLDDRDQFDMTPLMRAAASGTNNRPEIVKLLISAGANVTCKDQFARPAFDESPHSGYTARG